MNLRYQKWRETVEFNSKNEQNGQKKTRIKVNQFKVN